MMGAIIGDIVGSVFEFDPIKDVDFPLFNDESTFTDDTVLTVAVADAILDGLDLATTIKSYTKAYPGRGYGGMFADWVMCDMKNPYNSFGNGSAMRVSPVGFMAKSVEEVMAKAKWSAEVTHNHPEGIKGAQATALAIYMARTGSSKKVIKEELENRFEYDLSKSFKVIQSIATFNETCQVSVPEAIISFLASDSYEDAIRKAISLGADSDTQACIAGGIAEAFYKDIPEAMVEEARSRIEPELLWVIDRFYEKYS